MIEVGRRRVRPSRPDGRQGICVTQAPWAKGTEPPGSVPAPPAGPKIRKGREKGLTSRITFKTTKYEATDTGKKDTAEEFPS